LILILNMVLSGLLLGWLFLLDGTYGFYKWVPYLSFIFYIPALLGLFFEAFTEPVSTGFRNALRHQLRGLPLGDEMTKRVFQ
jgi:hypothetical protein